MKNILYRLLLLPWLLLAAWGARAQAPAWLSANGVPIAVNSDVRGVATNAAGDVFVTGAFEGSATFGTTTLTSTGSKDAYLAKWSASTSTWAWAVSGNGGGATTGDELSFGVAVNGNNVYITGTFNSSTISVAGSTLTLNGAGGTDMFVAKYYDNGTSVTNRQARQVSTAGTDAARSIAVNPSTGTVYVAGFITGTAGNNVSVAGSSLTLGGSGDILVVRYTDANPSASTSLADGGAMRGGGTGGDRADGIAVSSTGTIYVTGRVAAAGGTVSGSPLSSSGNNDIVLAKYTDSGSALVNGGAVANGGSDSDLALGVVASGSTIYVVGTFFSTSLTFGSSTLTNTAPNQRMFLARYTDSGSLSATGAVTSTGTNSPIELANAVTVAGGAIYVAGQYYNNPTISGTTLPATNAGNGEVFLAKYTDAAVPAGAGAISGGSASGIADYGSALAPFGSQVIAAGVIDPSGATFGSSTVQSGNGGFFARVGAAPTTITSIVPANTSPTNAASVQFTVTFASSVTGVTASNFTTANGTGVTGSSVTGVTGSGTTYTVTVNTGSGSGTLGLTLANDTNLTPGISNDPFTGTPLYTIDKTAPTVVISSTTGASGSTSSAATFAYTVTFSESVTGFVAGDVTVSNGTLSGFSGSGTTYTFNVTPAGNGAVTVNVPANVAQDAVGNANTAASQYSITYAAPNTTVTSVTRQTPSPTATTQVRYQVVFASSVTGISTSNFSLTTTGTISGASISSASGSGTTYSVIVNTGTGDGTLRLDVANSTGISPTVTNVPYTAGEQYTITKSFAAAPTLRIQAAGSASGNSDVTAFVDVVQVVQNGTSTVVANGLQNNSFESNNVSPSNFLYQSQGVVASPWSFGVQAGVSRNNSAFGSTAADGDAVALLQSTPSDNGSVTQNLAVPTGSYQIRFRALQRNYTSLDQRLNVFVNDVFVGTIQPNNIPTYDTFTSAAFSVTAPALTATVSTTSASPTSTSPVPFSVSFSQSVGTTFTASDVTVTGGTLTSGSFSGSGAGPYTFTVTPSGSGTVTVSLAANVATDANNTSNSASNSVSVQYNQPVTAAPVVIVPSNGSLASTTTPTYGGTAPASSTITVYVDGSAIGTTTANGAGNWAITQPSALSQGSHTVYATAQTSGSTVSANSNTNTFTVDSVRPTVAISSSTAASGSTTSTAPFAYTITFSESVTGFVAGDVTVSNGTLSGFSGSGATYTFNVAPTTAGTATTVNIPANVAQDQAGNGNTAATQYSLTFVAPTITVAPASLPSGTQGTAYSQVLSASGGTAPYTFVITAGALAPGLTLTSNGTLAGTPTVNGSFTFTVTATDNSAAPGPYSGSRSYTLSISTQPVTAAPVVIVPSNGSLVSTTTPTYGGTAPASSTITVYVDGSAIGTTTANGAGNWAIAQPSALSQGSHTVYATAQTSGSTLSANSNTNTFTVDSVRPTVAISSSTAASGSTTSTAPFAYTITFSESVTGFVAGDVTVSNGTLSGFSGSGATYTFNVTPTTAGTATTVNIPANVAQDQAGNGNTAATQYSLTFVAPTITVAPASLPSGTQGTAYSQALSASGGSGTYTFAITAGALPAGLSLTNGTIAGTPTVNGSFTFTVTATDNSAAPGPYSGSRSYTLSISTQPVTAAPVVIVPSNGSLVSTTTPTYGGTAPASSAITVYVDGSAIGTTTANGAGNWAIAQPTALAEGSHTVYATAQTSGSTVSANSNTNTFTVDSVRPTVAISSTAGASGSSTSTSPIPYTIAFSEAVTGFVAGDVTVAGGSLSGFSGSGATYSFNVTPAANGSTVTVNIPANVAQDQAGNGNTAATQYSLTFVAPTITIAPASLPSGTQGTAYSQALSASGGSGTYTFAITAGALPAGLSLTNGTIAGTPTVNGSFTFTVTATDNSAAPGPYSGSQAYTLTIAAPAVTSVTWTGTISTDWFTAGNWSPNQVPTATLDATIPAAPSGGRFPALGAGTANVRNFTLNSGATLAQNGGTLVVAANLTNNGTFQPTGGTVVLGNTTPGSILGSSNTRFWNLTIGTSGAQQSTSASSSVQRLLTLNGNFSTNGNSFTLESNANNAGMVVNNGSNVISGNVTVQRYISGDVNPNLGYRHFSSPISTATVGNLATASFSPVVNPDYNASAQPGTVTPFPTVYGYDQSRLATTSNNLSTFDKGWFSPSALSDALTVGQGYTLNLAANQTLSLTGPQNNGNIALNLARNNGATAADAGLALVGNPYPSPLDWSRVADADRPGLDRAIFVFQSNDPSNPYTGSYGFYNNGIGTISPILPLGQAFFVRVTPGQTTATLTLKNSHRPTTYTASTYRRTAAETRPLVQLTLKGAGSPVSDDAFVYFEQGATEGFDAQYDAMKLPNPNGLNLSTSIGSERLSIDGRSAVGTTQRVIPLAVGVPAAGSYSLSAAQLLNLDATPVYLRDLQLGTVTDLRATPNYQFTVTNASALLTNRFELVLSPQQALATVPAALAQQVALYPNPAKKAAFVELPASLGRQAVTATLVDALGRQVRTVSLPAQGALAHQLDLSELATGVYALRLSTSAGVVVKKLVIE